MPDVDVRGGGREVEVREVVQDVDARGGGRDVDPLQLTNSRNFFSRFVKPGP